MRKRIILIIALAILMGIIAFIMTKIKEQADARANIPQYGVAAEQEKEVNIIAVGDIMLGRNVAKLIGDDFKSPFADVQELLADADIRFGNLECVLSDSAEKIKGKDSNFCLKGPTKMVNVLKSGGFDIVSIANNHTYDFDNKGLSDTVNTLKGNEIEYVGAGYNLANSRELKIVEADGIKVGFLAYSDLAYANFADKNQIPAANESKSGVAPKDTEYILEDIEKNKEKCDLLFVSLHWGVEYTHVPQPSQKKLAYQIIDAGADAILGHHAHNLQGIEMYNGKPIIYSMSNFLFDQNADLNKDSGIFSLKYKDNVFRELEFIPLRIEEKKRTVQAEGEAKRKILDHMIKFSEVLGTSLEETDGRLYIRDK